MRGSNKVSFVTQGLPLPVFYCLQTADMEGFRKVFNVLGIEYRKNLQSVVFAEEEFLHERIQKDVPVNLTATMNIPEDAVKQYGRSMVALR